MRYLFVHQSIPGPFHQLAQSLAADAKNKVWFVSRFGNDNIPGVQNLRYQLTSKRGSTHPHLEDLQNGTMAGEAVATALLNLERDRNFRPDLVYAHPRGGEALFLKELFPDVPLIHYAAFYYHAPGADTFGNVDEVSEPGDYIRLRLKNAVNLLSLEACDHAVTPTQWQLSQQPVRYRHRISVIHDGIDTNAVHPEPAASLLLPDGIAIGFGDEVVTYVNRNLEPFRGMFVFAEAAAIVARKRPGCRFLVIGSETGHYDGPAPPKGRTYREMAIERLGGARERFYFMGSLPYADYLRVLQVSAAHVYLTNPLGLSRTVLEAMATACLVIGAATPPVAEVIRDNENGLLVAPFSPVELAERIDEALGHRSHLTEIAIAARETIIGKYALTVCLPAQKKLIEDVLGQSAATRFGIPRLA